MAEWTRRARRAVAVAAVLLASCGGGGDASSGAASLGPGESAYDDPQAYSTAPSAALDSAVEAAAVTKHELVLNGTTIAYTATAGHLIARNPAGDVPEASFFYVAYAADGAAAGTRPVTFFYNGGPGSASVWLHLGSFGPKRLATGVPATNIPAPFPFVDNSESLLDVTDLVFVDAVGTGLSEAIAPNTNQSFWGVDSDAAVFRDFIVRWLAANGRGASPRFLYGESYGGPRTAVLAPLLQAAGVMPDGLILQSPALDYNSNCGVGGIGSCAGYLPSYAAIGAYHGLASAATADLDSYLVDVRGFTVQRYAPAVLGQINGVAPPADMPPLLAGYTGIAASVWQSQFNLDPGTFQFGLFADSIIGRYDGRMKALRGSPLAAGDDPSSTYITSSFATTIASYLRDTLRYGTASTYVLTSNAINSWDFSHRGQSLPDTVPDLQAALAQDSALRVLDVNGYDDLATPFYQTELDLARLGNEPRLVIHDYPGGHMSYLDDGTRVRQKADVAAFYSATLAPPAARAARALPLALRPRPAPDRVGVVPTTPQPVTPEPALQTPLRDPWVPPRR